MQACLLQNVIETASSRQKMVKKLFIMNSIILVEKRVLYASLHRKSDS